MAETIAIATPDFARIHGDRRFQPFAGGISPTFAGAANTSQWKTAFRANAEGYSFGMVKTPTNADLVRLKQFLKALEIDDEQIELDEIDEVEVLKREIAYLEGVLYPSRAYLLREMVIDFGGSRGA